MTDPIHDRQNPPHSTPADYDLDASLERTRFMMRGTDRSALALVQAAEHFAKATRLVAEKRDLDLRVVAESLMIGASCIGGFGEQLGKIHGPEVTGPIWAAANVQAAAAAVILDDLERYATDPR